MKPKPQVKCLHCKSYKSIYCRGLCRSCYRKHKDLYPKLSEGGITDKKLQEKNYRKKTTGKRERNGRMEEWLHHFISHAKHGFNTNENEDEEIPDEEYLAYTYDDELEEEIKYYNKTGKLSKSFERMHAPSKYCKRSAELHKYTEEG